MIANVFAAYAHFRNSLISRNVVRTQSSDIHRNLFRHREH